MEISALSPRRTTPSLPLSWDIAVSGNNKRPDASSAMDRSIESVCSSDCCIEGATRYSIHEDLTSENERGAVTPAPLSSKKPPRSQGLEVQLRPELQNSWVKG